LDWGLGHATRCVPIIKMFIDGGANVIIGADNRPLAFLKKEFPDSHFIKFPGYNICYPEKIGIDIVVSDNRFGLWNKKTKCVFITHQLIVKCPNWLKYFEYLLMKINKYFINKYDECWVPDKENFKLSGELTKNYKSFHNLHLIGPLSRFNQYNDDYLNKIKYDVLFILSGPEPQRTIFENIILQQLKVSCNLNILIVRGLTESSGSEKLQENILFVDHLETNQLLQAISESDIIICRSGYSSIMDIVTLGKKAIFVPTPGQTEQKYLAKYYKNKVLFYSINQKKFSIFSSLEKSKFYQGLKGKYNNEKLAERVNFLLT